MTLSSHWSGRFLPLQWLSPFPPASVETETLWSAGDPVRQQDCKDRGENSAQTSFHMIQDLEVAAIPNSPSVTQWQAVSRFVLLSGLVGLLYYKVLVKLVTDWWQIPDFSHGFLVPVFALYLAWTKRDALRRTQLTPSWSGVVVVAMGMAFLLAGVYGAELFLARISLLILLSGLVLTFGGRTLLKELRFPLLVLLLAIPIPAIVFNQITAPLQTLASKLASALLPLFGVPVLREGNIINLPSMSLEVAEACSGIRSLMSLFTLSVFYGYFMEQSVWKRTLLALASIPIAIAANALRIFGTGLCVQYWNPDKAVGFFHEFSGWVMFLVSLACLFLLNRAIKFLAPQGNTP